MTRTSLKPLRALRRRWWLPVLTVVACAAIASAIGGQEERVFRATALVIVESGAGPDGPGGAGDAIRLAGTYATLATRDPNITERIARRIDVPVSEVEDDLTATNIAETALVELTYTSPKRATAIDGAREATRAMAGSDPASASIPDRSMRTVAIPPLDGSQRVDAVGGPSNTAAIVGGAFGLLLGLILVVGWERADPRADEIEDIEEATSLSATLIHRGDPSELRALMRRLRLAGGRDLALVPATPRSRKEAQAVAALLHSQGVDALVVDRAEEAPVDTAGILVTRTGTPLRRLVEARAAFDRAGLPAQWALAVRRRVARRAGAAPPPPPADEPIGDEQRTATA